MPRKPASAAKTWSPITSLDGCHQGEYEVGDGMLTVRYGGREQTTRAPSSGVPAHLGAEEDKQLARLMMLSERWSD